MAALRLFVAFGLPASYQDRLGELAEAWRGRLRSRTSWTRPGNWHLTLKFLGDVEEQRLAEVRGALEGVAFAPITARAGGAGTFPPRGAPRVLWVGLEEGAAEIAALATAVDRALEPLGFAPETRPFRPHLTLARVRRAERDPWPEMVGELARTSWAGFSVNGFTLWRSVLGPTGPKYTALADFGATSV